MTDALFIPQNGCFVPTPKAGSPWADDLVHGGPPAGLLARAIERFVPDPELHVTRLTIDLFRPVPKQPLEVTVRSIREGRRIHVVEAALLTGGIEVCRAVGLLLRRIGSSDGDGGVDIAMLPPGPEGIATTPLAGRPAPDRPIRPGFHTTIEARRVPRSAEGGPVMAWLRTPVPLVAGEELSPLVRLAALSDFVNPLSGAGARTNGGYINVDSTIYIHRLPVGEWIGLRVERAVEPYGIGVAHAILYDRTGPVGRCTQAALANQPR